MFQLHPRLEADTVPLARLDLCQVRLMNDATFPWLILVPEREGVTEIHRLEAADRTTLVEEIARVSRTLEALYHPDKLNVGALGNLVPQLHVHVVARYRSDRAWPGPVWGTGAPLPYDPATLERACEDLGAALAAA